MKEGKEVGVTPGRGSREGKLSVSLTCPSLSPVSGKGESDCQLGKGGKRGRMGRGREPPSGLVGAALCSCFRLMKGL